MKEYQARKPTVEQIKDWFAHWPEMNVGILTGALSGLIVVDVDEDRGGVESITELVDFYGPVVRTGRGYHYYFKHPGFEVQNLVNLLPGVDLRGDGGYVVAPPSLHETGKSYRWV